MAGASFELIHCSVPAGPETQLFLDRLTGELGLWSVAVSRSRRAIPERRHWRTRLVQSQERDEITILVPGHRVDQTFALAVDVLRVQEPGRGMIRRQRLQRAVCMALPEAGTTSQGTAPLEDEDDAPKDTRAKSADAPPKAAPNTAP